MTREQFIYLIPRVQTISFIGVIVGLAILAIWWIGVASGGLPFPPWWAYFGVALIFPTNLLPGTGEEAREVYNNFLKEEK